MIYGFEKGLGDVLWSHRDIFHKNTKRFSEKMLRVFLQNYKENFIEKIEICSAKKLRGVPQKYWEVFCRNKVFCRTAGLSSTLWHKKNNFLVKTYCVKSVQIRSFFWPVFSKNAGKYGPEKNSVFGHFSRSDSKTTSVTSCPSVLGYDTISNYWARSHLQVFDTLEPATGGVL